MLLAALRPVCQPCDHLSEREQRLVDIDRLFLGEARGPCRALSFRAGQVHELKFADDGVVNSRVIDNVDLESEYAVRP